MTPYIDDADFTLYVGDVRDVLRELPDGSVDCVVTSPPYWGLRDYGTGEWDGGDPGCDHAKDRSIGIASSTLEGGKATTNHQHEASFRNACGKCGARRIDQQLGLEPTPDEYVRNMVAVFREVRRVLAAHGTCWVNLGDSYASNWPCNRRNVVGEGSLPNGKREARPPRMGDGLKDKDLVGIPWRVAFALQADGWYLRSDIIWAKPNPMPESVTDRPTKAHEYVFLLTKSPRYFFDQEAVREPAEYGRREWGNGRIDYDGGTVGVRRKVTTSGADPSTGRNVRSVWEIAEQETLDPSLPPEKPRKTAYEGKELKSNKPGWSGNPNVHGEKGHALPGAWQEGEGRNVRSVWNIATQPYPEAHFATFPEELARRCIAAGCPEWVCGSCGKPRERIVAKDYLSEPTYKDAGAETTLTAGRNRNVTRMGDGVNVQTLGWSDCGHNNYKPGTVLDPFMGSGTTALIARKLGRRSIGIELSQEYAELCARRLQQQSLFA